jgi:hypothetical protein
LPLLVGLRRLSLRVPLYLRCGTLIALYAIVPRSTPKTVSEMKRIMMKTMMAVAAFALATGTAQAGYWYTDIYVSGVGYVPADIYDSGSWLDATLHFPDGNIHHADGWRDGSGHIDWTWKD